MVADQKATRGFERDPAHSVLVLKAPQHSKAHAQKFDIQAFPDGVRAWE